MANFDSALSALHGGSGVKTIDADANIAITITPQRTFDVPQGYNTVLAYAGDINSQIVTFTLPQFHEGHDLSQCSSHCLKWKNKTSGAEGKTELTSPKVNTELKTWTTTWEIPPEAMTHAGSLEIAISIYDILDSNIAFSWNTAVYRGFSIGEAFSEVGVNENGVELPAKNEILNVDVETRSIIMPSGYKTTFCNYGDIGVSTIYFQIDK